MTDDAIDEFDHERHVRRAIDLTRDGADRGDRPFGSVLVRDDAVVAEASNRVVTADDLRRHPELDLAQRASREDTPDEGRDVPMETVVDGRRRAVVVECKHTATVGRPAVQKIHSAAATFDFDGPRRGMVVTTGRFTGPAEEYAERLREGDDPTRSNCSTARRCGRSPTRSGWTCTTGASGEPRGVPRAVRRDGAPREDDGEPPTGRRRRGLRAGGGAGRPRGGRRRVSGDATGRFAGAANVCGR